MSTPRPPDAGNFANVHALSAGRRLPLSGSSGKWYSVEQWSTIQWPMVSCQWPRQAPLARPHRERRGETPN
eukprot:3647871-Prymnesium_polylepis.1